MPARRFRQGLAAAFRSRRSRSRGKLFFRLVQQAVAVEPTTYASIVRNTEAKLQPPSHWSIHLVFPPSRL